MKTYIVRLGITFLRDYETEATSKEEAIDDALDRLRDEFRVDDEVEVTLVHELTEEEIQSGW